MAFLSILHNVCLQSLLADISPYIPLVFVLCCFNEYNTKRIKCNDLRLKYTHTHIYNYIMIIYNIHSYIYNYELTYLRENFFGQHITY